MKKSGVKPIWVTVLFGVLIVAVTILVVGCFYNVICRWRDISPDETSRPSQKTSKEYEALHTHHWQSGKVVLPTCTEEGYMSYICSCGEEKREDKVPAKGHSEFVLKNEKEASDSENGYTGDKYCGICGALVKEGSVIPAKEHENIVLQNYKAPTCLAEGYSGDWYCADCREIVVSGKVLPKTDHHYDNGTEIPATCLVGGQMRYHCLDCGFEKSETITPKGDHVLDCDGKCAVCEKFFLDVSGDFGASFPQVFMQDKSIVNLTDDSEIRAYAEKHGLELSKEDGTVYLALYRSHDVYMTVKEVSKKLYVPSKNRYDNSRYYDYDVYVRNIENIFTVTPGSTATMDKLVEKGESYSGNKVIGAINGDYTTSKSRCFVALRNGQLLRRNDESLKADICVLYKDGTMKTYTPVTYNWEKLNQKEPYQIWCFGPALIDSEGNPRATFDAEIYGEKLYGDDLLAHRHPRAAIGYYAPGHYALVVGEGRKSGFYGFYGDQFAKLMVDLGCKEAYNLDGGDSAQAYLNGELIRTANRDEQRKLADIICVGEYTPKE